jgi:homoserine O-succinyltransferase
LLNIMPDAAVEAPERQFFRLLGASTLDTPLYLHPFTIDGLPRRPETADHIQRYYQTLQHIQAAGLDALIISGANVTHAHLQQEAFWQPLTDVFDWATAHVNSVLCSCLATHALFQHRYGIERTRLPAKRWGVFSHQVLAPTHPLMSNVEPYFDVPHSRFNAIFQNDMLAHGLQVLVASEVAGVHLATSPDGFRVVYFQGHPEYDAISLLKEYKREVGRFYRNERSDYPPYPDHYFNANCQALLEQYAADVSAAKDNGTALADMPEDRIIPQLTNSWQAAAQTVFSNWLGQLVHLQQLA